MIQTALLAYDEQDALKAEQLAQAIRTEIPTLDLRMCGVEAPAAGEIPLTYLGATADVEVVICAIGPDTAQDGTLDYLIAGARKIERPLLGVLLDGDLAVDLLPIPLAAPEDATILGWDMAKIVKYLRNDAALNDQMNFNGVQPIARTVMPPG